MLAGRPRKRHKGGGRKRQLGKMEDELCSSWCIRSPIRCKLSSIRVRVDHAIAGIKRSRIVKDICRNTKITSITVSGSDFGRVNDQVGAGLVAFQEVCQPAWNHPQQIADITHVEEAHLRVVFG